MKTNGWQILNLILLVYIFVGCDGSSDNQARTALNQLNDRFTTLSDQVVGLNKKVDELSVLIDERKKKTPPVQPVVFSPDPAMNDDPFLGPKDSTVMIMAFSNFQCQPCRTFVTQTFAKLRSDYFDATSGSVRYVLRDYPLSSNPQAVKAAELAHCAGEQGLYWEAHDTLFANPEKVDKGEFKDIVEKISRIDIKKALSCLKKGRYKKEIEADVAAGLELGAKGAPNFFIGRKNGDGDYQGTYIRGAQPYEVLSAAIDTLLEPNDGIK